jgi:8-oxo-dGTP pyrophosphatase MutT (NUDIX family)
MKPFQVSPAREITVRFSNKEVRLPEDIQSKINTYWNELIASGRTYKRGEVFTVTHKEVTQESVSILVEKTDYAHYLYCQNKESLEENGVHIIHTAVLVETSDEYYIFGEMGPQTSRHGIIQLCGGGIDNGDLRGEYFDFKHNIIKELQEELDIDAEDTARVSYFDEAYLKEGGPTDKMTVIFRVVLHETKDKFLEKYNVFVEGLKEINEDPEFGKIIALKNDKKEIIEFFSQENLILDEYMKPLFEKIASEIQ